jgi:hypothetical protein
MPVPRRPEPLLSLDRSFSLRWLPLTAWLLLLAACGSEEATLDHDAGPADAGDLTELEQRRTARKGIDVQANGATATTQITIGDLQDLVHRDCYELLRATSNGTPFKTVGANPTNTAYCDFSQNTTPLPPADANACNQAICQTEVRLCIANRLLELASAIAPTPLNIPVSGSLPAQTVIVMPQDEESKTAIREVAFDWASRGMLLAGENLRKAAGKTTTIGVCTASQLSSGIFLKGTTGPTYANALAAAFAEASLVGDEAARAASKSNVAVAAADFSRAPDSKIAATFSWSNGEMSRARAAHLLIGGYRWAGLADYKSDDFNASLANSKGVCSAAPPSGKAAEAKDVLRLAAAHPLVIGRSSLSFNTLFESGATIPGTSTTDASLRDRLAERTGDDTFRTMSASKFLADRGLTESDFIAARSSISDETKAFGRDVNAQLPTLPVASIRASNGSLVPQRTTKPIYAATARPPVKAPTGYYRTQVRFPNAFASFGGNDNPGTIHDGYPLASGVAIPTYSTMWTSPLSLKALLDYGRMVSSELSLDAAASTVLPDTAMRQINMYLAADGQRVKGRLETCNRFVMPTGGTVARDEYRVRVYGTAAVPASSYRLVVGAAGLRCATEGSDDGAPCSNLDTYGVAGAGGQIIGSARVGDTRTVPTSTAPNADYEPRAGFSTFFEVNIASPPPIAATTAQYSSMPLAATAQVAQQVYVVRRKTGANDAPGGYVLVGGFPTLHQNYNTASPAFRFCTMQPIVPDVDTLADQVIEPSRDDCKQTPISCAMTDLNTNIPLESELTEDGDAFESSWKTQLHRARLAADHADDLGDQMIGAGLEIDRRVESSVEQIQTLCGESISLSSYFPGNMSGYRGGTCPTTAEGQRCTASNSTGAPEHSVCTSGTCVVDPLSILQDNVGNDPDARKILDCLSDATLVDLSIGKQPMCVYIKKGTNEVCSPLAGVDCPYLATESPPGSKMYTCLPPLHAPANFGTSYDVRNPATETLNYSDIAKPEDPNQKDAPVCSALRALRTNSGTGTRETRLGTIAPFLKLERVQALATRIRYKAGPDDYSTVSVDGVPMFTTGDIWSTTEVTAWPCSGAPSIQREDSFGVSCAASGVSELNPMGLFCSYTSQGACKKTVSLPNRTSRARINHRLGRAVLALKVITGTGLSGFDAPYMMNRSYAKHETGDDFGSDFSIWTDFGDADHATNLPDSRAIRDGSSTRFMSVEWTGDNSWNTNTVPGYGLCFVGPTGGVDVWTDFDPATGVANDIPSYCDNHPFWGPPSNGNPGGFHRATFPSFKTYSGMADHSQGRVSDLWFGLNGTGARRAESQVVGFRQAIHDAVVYPYDQAGIVVPPHGNDSDTLSGYWKDTWRVVGYEIDANGDSDPTRPIWGLKNDIALAREGLTTRDVLDGLELACEVERTDAGAADCSAEALTAPTTMAEVGMVERQLHCAADAIKRQAEKMVFLDVPKAVKRATEAGAQLKGELGAAAGEFSAALKDLYRLKIDLNAVLDEFAIHVRLLRDQLEGQSILAQEVNLDLVSKTLNLVTSCLAEETPNASDIFRSRAFFICANSLAQISIAIKTAKLEERGIEIKGDITWAEFQSFFNDHADAITKIGVAYDEAQAKLAAALARITTARLNGLRELSKAMMLSTDAMGQSFAVSTVMRRRYNTLLVRYEDARDLALKAAWIARRAIETRLGIDLTKLDKKLLLVASPKEWADSLCTLPAYKDIREDTGNADPGTVGVKDDNYADGYIGDYVTKLENVIASYDFDYPFHEGQDTAVVSLRDDVLGLRDYCEISVPNRLAYSSELDHTIDPSVPATQAVVLHDENAVPSQDVGLPVWMPRNCAVLAQGVHNCTSVSRLDASSATERPTLDVPVSAADVRGYRVTFGGGAAASSSFQPWTGTEPRTVIGQEVPLETGYYRLSWYGRQVAGSLLDPRYAVSLRTLDMHLVNAEDDGPRGVPTGSGTASAPWMRAWRLFYVATPGTYLVTLDPAQTVTAAHSVDLGAIMLENLSDRISGPPEGDGRDPDQYPPAEYMGTTQAGVGWAPRCEDTDGNVFRAVARQGWEQVCVGPADTCAGSTERSYREFPFTITLPGLEQGSLLSQSGFASGNFNYRIENLAVNFVGTALKDCSHATLPSSCQANASIPFTIAHRGPFTVRNHAGEPYDVKIFSGKIEHGRGLAAERYLTNPLSGADRGLIDPYTHNELRGRPLTGQFVLRVYDGDGIAFDNLQDIQIVLDYRYWTRFGFEKTRVELDH